LQDVLVLAVWGGIFIETSGHCMLFSEDFTVENALQSSFLVLFDPRVIPHLLEKILNIDRDTGYQLVAGVMNWKACHMPHSDKLHNHQLNLDLFRKSIQTITTKHIMSLHLNLQSLHFPKTCPFTILTLDVDISPEPSRFRRFGARLATLQK